MRKVKINLNDDLLESMDKIVKELKTNRSSFTRDALRNAIPQHKIQCQEERHRKGYRQHPVQKGEFGVWENEQDWGGEMKRGEIHWHEFKSSVKKYFLR